MRHFIEPNSFSLEEQLALLDLADRMEPVVTMLPGWNRDISGCKSWDDLPKEAKGYVEFLEQQLGHAIQFISTGAERERFVLKGEWL